MQKGKLTETQYYIRKLFRSGDSVVVSIPPKLVELLGTSYVIVQPYLNQVLVSPLEVPVQGDENALS